MKFPPQINKATGRFMVSAGEQNVKESVYTILMTQKTERWIRPEFGSELLSYTFMDISLTRMNMMSRQLQRTLLEQEPRIVSADVEIKPQLDRGCLIINVTYTVAETNTSGNLVFPFYLYSETEGDDSVQQL